MRIEALIAHVAGRTALDEGQVRAALSGALSLIRTHADPALSAKLFEAVPGAGALAEAAPAVAAKGGGLMGGLMKGLGGQGGAAMSDAMAMIKTLAADGVQMSDLQALLPVARSFLEQEGAGDVLGEVLKSIPGVGPMLGGR